jgi:hypothetical protein
VVTGDPYIYELLYIYDDRFKQMFKMWVAAYTWIHVFVIAFLQLYVFRRFDFVSMYSFRLFYYAYWHILWGVIRLEVLF